VPAPLHPDLVRILAGLSLDPRRAPSADEFAAVLAAAGARLTEHEVASGAKDALVAATSHELRTPLGGVLGLADLLLAGDGLGPEQRELVETIARSARMVLAIADDLLDHAKASAGALEVRERDCDPRRTLADVVDAQRAAARARGLALTLELGPDLPAAGRTDPSRLRQVLANLVGNAIKYTQAGSIAVIARCAPDRAGRRRLHVEVHDTGIGVPEDDAARLFQRFSRAHGPAHARVEGSGLGLAIVREIVERMGGEVGYAPRTPAGSTFWFALPLPPATTPPKHSTLERFPTASVLAPVRVRGRVLVAEDDRTNQTVARRMLEKLGFEVVVEGDGASAVAAARARGFALILMDLQMPRLDGIAATQAIRREEQERRDGSHVPIVAMTANAMRGDREACLAAGMDDYLAKPVTFDALGAMIERWVSSATAPRPVVAVVDVVDLVDVGVGVTPASDGAEPLRLDAIAGAGASSELLAELADLFLESAQQRVRGVEDALVRGAFAEMKRHAHALKGACLTIGANRLASRAAWLEGVDPAAEPVALEACAAELRGELASVARALAAKLDAPR
jgi:signal transduction histidine kinase/CheY-like chemotaxis protein/HPt (histidine-containing phosphotransfer) domain-containing protein